ncbi:MAG TPA: asparagine synthase (glutamine-hydrolyzing) [Micropepsaceae bacterium]|nr:asparagine synthase (glutamine-hydrolyzing) [Micropepsaceae bacterium]
MCGIGGYMTAEGAAPPPVLDTLLSALAHRGPDGEGRYTAAGAGLVQTRLAIIDLDTGDQPLFGDNGAALVANGEIYNYLELRREFSARAFRTASDCELPLATYERDGGEFAASLRGMYAIALHDARERALYLVRDPFGIKPLYYAEYSGGILFASEAQALLRTGLVPLRLRSSKSLELLQLQFTTGRSTIFESVQRVLPGETLTLRGGHIVDRSIHAALPEARPQPIGEQEALKRVDAALMDSVAIHQRADVPYGLFLSGGIDSSAILACMARLNESPVRAFTAGFPGTAAHDERQHAKAVARAAGADHVEVEVTGKQFWRHLPAIIAAMDEPAADYAIVPTWFLAAEAAKELKVVLTGEGGDEIFAGYSRYRTLLRSPFLGGRVMRKRGFLDGLGVLRDQTYHWREGVAAAERRLASSDLDALQQAQALDCADWLPNDLLVKLDRCLMAHGLEGRTPLLDPVVAAAGFCLPDGLKISGRSSKYLLRKWLAATLPAAEPFAPKRGFTVPVAEWIQSRAGDLAGLVADSSGIAELCVPDGVRRLFARFGDRGGKHEGNACWILLFYALWHRIHIGRVRSDMDVFETLHA